MRTQKRQHDWLLLIISSTKSTKPLTLVRIAHKPWSLAIGVIGVVNQLRYRSGGPEGGTSQSSILSSGSPSNLWRSARASSAMAMNRCTCDMYVICLDMHCNVEKDVHIRYDMSIIFVYHFYGTWRTLVTVYYMCIYIYLFLSHIYSSLLYIYIIYIGVVFFLLLLLLLLLWLLLLLYIYTLKKRQLDPSNWIHWTTMAPVGQAASSSLARKWSHFRLHPASWGHFGKKLWCLHFIGRSQLRVRSGYITTIICLVEISMNFGPVHL
jgi:hypothetical protein